jgi:hypothetical protein
MSYNFQPQFFIVLRIIKRLKSQKEQFEDVFINFLSNLEGYCNTWAQIRIQQLNFTQINADPNPQPGLSPKVSNFRITEQELPSQINKVLVDVNPLFGEKA